MPILSYVPEKKNIIDHRSPNGGYYTAKCNVCGTEFYPKRSNAKYCSTNCSMISNRTAKAELLAKGGIIKPKLRAGKPKSKPGNSKPAQVGPKGTVVTGKDAVAGLLTRAGLKTYGLKAFLGGLATGETGSWEGKSISRINLSRYQVN